MRRGRPASPPGGMEGAGGAPNDLSPQPPLLPFPSDPARPHNTAQRSSLAGAATEGSGSARTPTPPPPYPPSPSAGALRSHTGCGVPPVAGRSPGRGHPRCAVRVCVYVCGQTRAPWGGGVSCVPLPGAQGSPSQGHRRNGRLFPRGDGAAVAPRTKGGHGRRSCYCSPLFPPPPSPPTLLLAVELSFHSSACPRQPELEQIPNLHLWKLPVCLKMSLHPKMSKCSSLQTSL
ncbi:uncharacterized protein LOC129203756 [Grus americana]|uniref:uncharacterized protein LOC129203756 n=1 Tax=Grus americana TaxID=9117 RepID=UPI0024087F29|nr:uncharacterized protein LOC129203756 [Grus americana]